MLQAGQCGFGHNVHQLTKNDQAFIRTQVYKHITTVSTAGCHWQQPANLPSQAADHLFHQQERSGAKGADAHKIFSRYSVAFE